MRAASRALYANRVAALAEERRACFCGSSATLGRAWTTDDDPRARHPTWSWRRRWRSGGYEDSDVHAGNTIAARRRRLRAGEAAAVRLQALEEDLRSSPGRLRRVRERPARRYYHLEPSTARRRNRRVRGGRCSSPRSWAAIRTASTSRTSRPSLLDSRMSDGAMGGSRLRESTQHRKASW